MKKIRLHWALGCLGITIGSTYRDIRVDTRDWTLHLFVRSPDSKSWYQRRGATWILLRREDVWGTYRCALDNTPAHRRPALRDRPASIPDRAWELRRDFVPYKVIDWYGEQLEVISYPCPEKNRVTVLLRELNNPGTLQEVALEEYV